jgi:hypothetical protein
MIMHWKKARAIYNLLDMKDDARHLERQIALATEMIGDKVGNMSNMLECLRKMFFLMVQRNSRLCDEHNGNICVITGPVTYPRQVREETILHVDSNLIIPNNGCPVIFHGLISSSHLNGKLGGVRGYTNINKLDTFRVVVQIENGL